MSLVITFLDHHGSAEPFEYEVPKTQSVKLVFEHLWLYDDEPHLLAVFDYMQDRWVIQKEYGHTSVYTDIAFSVEDS